MKKAQYICAGAALGVFVLMLLYLGIGGTLSDAASSVILILISLTASASAVIASVIRYKDGRHYAYSVFFAFFFFSLIYSVYQHIAVFAAVLAALALASFVLAYGAYSSRSDRFAMASYVGILTGLVISFAMAYVA